MRSDIPNFSVETWAKHALPCKDQAITDRIIAFGRKAGFPG